MIESTHSLYHFLLLSSLVDLAYLLQNQLQASPRLTLVVCACNSQVYCIFENKKCKSKVKIKASGPMSAHVSQNGCVRACVVHACT